MQAYRRIKINEDRTWDVFAVAGLGKESIEGAWIAKVRIRIGTAVCFEAMLEEVSIHVQLSVGFGWKER